MLAEHSGDSSAPRPRGAYLYVRPRARRYRLRPEELIGTLAAATASRRRTLEAVGASASSLEGARGRPDRDRRGCRPDGSVRWLETAARAIRDDARRARARRVTRDVTERKQAEPSSPTRRCTTRSPACRTARCSSTASTTRCAAPSAASRLGRRAVPRPRPLQGRQRLARPRRRRPPAVRVAGRLARARCARATRSRASAATSSPSSARTSPARPRRAPIAQRIVDAVRASRSSVDGRRGRSCTASIGIALAAATDDRARGPAARRRRRDVPRQGRAARAATRCSTRRCARDARRARSRPRASCAARSSATSCACTTSRSSTSATRRDRGLRGAGALGAPERGPARAGRVHPARRGDRADRRASATGCCARPAASAARWADARSR